MNDVSLDDLHWFALYTKSRHEKKVDKQLREKGIESYLPLRGVWRQWSDRRKLVEEPLFRCYVFVHTNEKQRIRALSTYGAVRFVSFNGRPAIVRDEEIEMIKRILREFPEAEACQALEAGDLVEIVRGPLTGIIGRLEEVRGTRRLVVMIESIHQGVRFEVDRLDVRLLEKGRTPAPSRYERYRLAP